MVGMAYPGTLIIDRRGRVQSRFFEESYVERSTASSILMQVGGTNQTVPGIRVSTAHLDVAAYPTEASVAVGNHFSIAFDITPRPGIHVYAPGASNYRAIAVSISPQPFVRILPIRYPQTQTYFFEPLKERVPVYQKPFTLVQEIVLEGTREAQAVLRGQEKVTISGRLDYQACDETVCFTPASVPLSWTIPLRPLVTERPPRPQ
jgi:hypothetical protein